MAPALRQKMKTVFVPSLIALLVAACSSPNVITESMKNEAYASSEFYINKAEQAKDKEDKVSYQLLAVRKLVEENKADEAQDALNELSPFMKDIQENPVQKQEYALVSAQLLALQGKNDEALSLLRNLQQNLKNEPLSQAQLLRVYQTQAQVAENRKDVEEIVRAHSLMNSYLFDNKARQENNDTIWNTLRKANRGIEQAQPQAAEMEFAGWIALISLYNQNVMNPTQMQQALNQWKAQYPNHSAVNFMPSELQNVASYQQTQLKDVAVLLPLSGDAQILGQVVQQGFNDARGNDGTVVRFYDTAAGDVNSLIAQAKQEGAGTIVGPLLKENVDTALNSPEIKDVNLLALNATPNARAIPQVCYYGLSPEAEAKAAADRIYNDGKRNVIVSVPQGDFGQRSADTFAQRWRQLTGNDADVRYYSSAEDAVASVLSAGTNQGGLYLLGSPEDVLAIKQGIDGSALKDQFAIYTSSRSNSPANDADFYTAMEGVKFSEIPLLADPSSDEYKKSANLSAGDFAKMRLYAMGADAWSLANKFNELSKIPGYKVSGLTGVLSAGQNCNIERSLSWLQYHNGTVEQAN
nr:penicillin-binding protein activator [uncultured Haemophilus sp.]